MKKMFYAVFLGMLFVSCKSVPAENRNLTGMVVDEKNRPVSEFVLTCKDEKGKEVATAITGENGMFVFYDVGYGDYLISGKKPYFTRIENEKYTFSKQSDFCACQIMTFEEALMSFYRLLPTKPEEAKRILDSIYQVPVETKESDFLEE